MERCRLATPPDVRIVEIKRRRLLVWENVEEDDEPRHLSGVDRPLVRGCGQPSQKVTSQRSWRSRGAPAMGSR